MPESRNGAHDARFTWMAPRAAIDRPLQLDDRLLVLGEGSDEFRIQVEVRMRLTPGGVRELHWHKEAEWAYRLAGKACITAVDQDRRNFIADVGEGDLWYFPEGVPHSLQELDEGAEFLLAINDGSFSEASTFALTGMMKRFPRRYWRKRLLLECRCPRSAGVLQMNKHPYGCVSGWGGHKDPCRPQGEPGDR
jgi:quercetin dioxygenase-like cupin family protein